MVYRFGYLKRQAIVDLALQQTQFAARVIARMRDFTESRQPDFVDFNVVDLLNQSVHLLDWVFGAESVRVILSGSENEEGRCALAPPLPSELNAKGDRTMIQQVFTNLLRNAIDALRATPTDKG